MTTLQEKRQAALVNMLARRSKERDEAVRWLALCELRWQHAKKDLARYTKRLASLAASSPARAEKPERPAVTPPAPATPADDGIPDFLRRETAQAVDALAAMAIQAQQQQAKKVKAANRIGKLKAVQAERMVPKQKLAESIRRGGIPG